MGLYQYAEPCIYRYGKASAYNNHFCNAAAVYQSGGTRLAAWSGITVAKNMDYINENYQIAVLYSGNSAPKLALENKYDGSWNVNVSACDVRDGTAYYKYSDLADCMDTYGVSIYDMGKVVIMATADNTAVYDVYAVPVF